MIEEDNLIEQLHARGKKVVFMGDDTWISLYPSYFYKSYPFPSFNVKDLHTVDNGVLKNLMPTVRGGDWDVVIGHFLGVDHVGHRTGPSHPSMVPKLGQMNSILTELIEYIDNLSDSDPTTALFVFGDHGMTPGGNHGGASFDETHAALFVHSSTPIFSAISSSSHSSQALQEAHDEVKRSYSIAGKQEQDVELLNIPSRRNFDPAALAQGNNKALFAYFLFLPVLYVLYIPLISNLSINITNYIL